MEELKFMIFKYEAINRDNSSFFFIPATTYPDLVSWMFTQKFTFKNQRLLVTRGTYQGPKLVYLPSVVY
jgi:hypothetical protein